MAKRMNTMVLKEMNRRKVVDVLLQAETATIQEISQKTELSTVTVGTIINECMVSGEVLETSLTVSQGGRPARTFRVNQDYLHGMIVFGYLRHGQDRIFYRIIDRCGTVVKEWMGEEAVITREHIESSIERAMDEDPLIKGIGFGLPGVEYRGKMEINDYEGLKGMSIRDYFTQRFKLPVFVENDVNLAVIGYNARQEVPHSHCVFLYFPGKYPPGAGVVIRGELYKGRDGYVGEVNGLSHSFDWERFKEGSMELKVRRLKALIQDISVWINPDFLVLSGNGVDEGLLSHLEYAMETWERKAFLPKVGISLDFDLDFERGLSMMLRSKLEEKRWER